MPSYRLYCFDGAGRIITAEWLEAVDDAEAIEAATVVKRGVHCEIWDRNRMIAKLENRAFG